MGEGELLTLFCVQPYTGIYAWAQNIEPWLLMQLNPRRECTIQHCFDDDGSFCFYSLPKSRNLNSKYQKNGKNWIGCFLQLASWQNMVMVKAILIPLGVAKNLLIQGGQSCTVVSRFLSGKKAKKVLFYWESMAVRSRTWSILRFFLAMESIFFISCTTMIPFFSSFFAS